MDQPLLDKKIAILVANGFAETQMTTPQRDIIQAGAKTAVISPEPGLVNGWHETGWGHYFPIDVPLADALGADYDMLLVPGGKRSVGKLSESEHTARIIRSFDDAQKPIIAIGDGVLLLQAAERLAGRTVTTDADVAEQIEGATLSDEDFVVDGHLMTVRNADTHEDLSQRLIAHFSGETELRDAA